MTKKRWPSRSTKVSADSAREGAELFHDWRLFDLLDALPKRECCTDPWVMVGESRVVSYDQSLLDSLETPTDCMRCIALLGWLAGTMDERDLADRSKEQEGTEPKASFLARIALPEQWKLSRAGKKLIVTSERGWLKSFWDDKKKRYVWSPRVFRVIAKKRLPGSDPTPGRTRPTGSYQFDDVAMSADHVEKQAKARFEALCKKWGLPFDLNEAPQRGKRYTAP